MDIRTAVDGVGLPEVVARELGLVELPVTALLNGCQPGSGVGVSAADASPSRERLVRIATMIRDADLALPLPARRTRRQQGARLIPLGTRRHRSAAVRRGTAAAVVDLAS